jgi:uncharacterized Fe-S cluster protein YjdI
MPAKTHRYTKDNLTVIWRPEQCIHSTLCWKNLAEVFNPKERPWIKMDGASVEAIIEQVKKCPSGALSYELSNEQADDSGNETASEPDPLKTGIIAIKVRPNGPILIQNECEITHIDGRKEIIKGNIALCRCGHSGNKPFCDGSHKLAGFVG